MRVPKQLQPLLHQVLTLHVLFAVSVAHQVPSFCSRTRNHFPISLPNSAKEPSLLDRVVLCKSQKPYLRTTLGLFPISSVNHTSKLITISDHHHSCSPSLHFVPPSLLSAGFYTPQPNYVLLFNCSNSINPMPPWIRNCSRAHDCAAAALSSCLLVHDAGESHGGIPAFDPKVLGCSHYTRVFKTSGGDGEEEFELGTRMSVEITGHVPDVCGDCHQTDGSCGAALRCLCHPKECSDKVFSSVAGSINPSVNMLCYMLPFIAVLVGLMDCLSWDLGN